MSAANVPQLVILFSGNGSNLQAVIDAVESGQLCAEVALVVSNRDSAYGLQRAAKHNIPSLVHLLKPYKDRLSGSSTVDIAGVVQSKSELISSSTYREVYDNDLAQAILARIPSPALLVLAGFMHILSPAFLKHFSRRVINLHPALPGEFDGAHAIERAFAAFKEGKITRTGIMVHHVIPEVDRGEVILKREVIIESTDTLESLENRIHSVEHQLLIDGINAFFQQQE